MKGSSYTRGWKDGNMNIPMDINLASLSPSYINGYNAAKLNKKVVADRIKDTYSNDFLNTFRKI